MSNEEKRRLRDECDALEAEEFNRLNSVKECLIEICLKIGLVFAIIPMLIFAPVVRRIRLFWYLRGKTDAAWSRCASLWQATEHVYGRAIGPYFYEPFEHALTVSFAAYHPDARDFLLAQIRDPDPRLAANAVLCLIPFGAIERSEIPKEAWLRIESFYWYPFGCMGKDVTLGKFISEHIKREETEVVDAELAGSTFSEELIDDAFDEAQKWVQESSVGYDRYLSLGSLHDRLSIDFLAHALGRESKTLKGVSWLAEEVRRCAADAHWPDPATVPDERLWAYWSARKFLEVCVQYELGLSTR